MMTVITDTGFKMTVSISRNGIRICHKTKRCRYGRIWNFDTAEKELRADVAEKEGIWW